MSVLRITALILAILPSGWLLNPPSGETVQTGTMPQGAALSADGSKLAIVESGFNAPALSIYETRSLRRLRRVPLSGAFGRPVWTRDGILVAGANADVVYLVDPMRGAIRRFGTGRNSYPVAVAEHNGVVAVSLDGSGTVMTGRLRDLAHGMAIAVGSHPANLVFSSGGENLFVAVRSGTYIAYIDTRSGDMRRIRTGLHPSDVLIKDHKLYVTEADADNVGVYSTDTLKRVANIFVGNAPLFTGSSPNALSSWRDSVLVTLGAANEVVVIRGDRIVKRFGTGWYPTDVLAVGDAAYVINGKGEGTKPNPAFDVFSRGYRNYIAAIEYGSVRVFDLSRFEKLRRLKPAAGQPYSIIRKNGPLKHLFFILKENRSFDQILGDMRAGNGDAKLAWFGGPVTPNQHAIAQRFGLFDNFYASGEVSDSGHNWADAAFANDYVERYWPPAYGRRRDADDILTGSGAAVPARGFIWDEARSAHVTFRDYGEMVRMPQTGSLPPTTAPSLGNRFDSHYIGWNLDYSDLDRVREWKREFEHFVAAGSVPQLEYMWLPNDHTYGSRAGKLTPAAYIAINDYAVGLIVDTISHSKIWGSSAIFITEDDAQDGADHISDQRTTLYIASPYARGGTVHGHYSTVSVLRTIELCLGMRPLSTYDEAATPLYAAFDATRGLQPFDALLPKIDVKARNAKTAYDERRSEQLNFSGPDAAPPGVLSAILSHNRAFRTHVVNR